MKARVVMPAVATVLVVAFISACGLFRSRPPEMVEATPAGMLEAHGHALVDTAPKEDVRMVPPEVYMRTYLHLFGDLAPPEAQKRAKAADGTALFDTWDDYVSALGFPDHRMDQPRQTQTNALMMAAFERLGVALCDRALEHDWKSAGAPGAPPAPPNKRIVFAFDSPKAGAPPIDREKFAPGFDIMHRTFLGYPAELAPTPRTQRFFQLYHEVEASHAKDKSRFTAAEAGWAAVCYGLVRHPEFHLY